MWVWVWESEVCGVQGWCLFEGEFSHIDDQLDGIWHLMLGGKGLPPKREA